MMLMRQRIQLSNVIRGHMAEFGLMAPIGREGLHSLIKRVATVALANKMARMAWAIMTTGGSYREPELRAA